MKLSLTKRLMMGVILSAVVGSTAAVACTHVVNTANGCPIVTSSQSIFYQPTYTTSTFPASTYSSGSLCLPPADNPTQSASFDVYGSSVLTGGQVIKGTATAQVLNLVCGSQRTPTKAFILQSASVTWSSGTAAYATNPADYQQCCQSGT